MEDKLAVIKAAILKFESAARSQGTFHPAQARMPSYWEVESWGLRIVLSVQVLRLPTDSALSTILDVWPAQTRLPKVLSASWEPTRPWQPPHVSSFRAGDWMALLDLGARQPGTVGNPAGSTGQ